LFPIVPKTREKTVRRSGKGKWEGKRHKTEQKKIAKENTKERKTIPWDSNSCETPLGNQVHNVFECVHL
jgi:hypothetical protein